MKRTFIFYNDWGDYIEEMNNEEKGLFLQTILNYQSGKELGDLGIIKFVWSRVKKQLDDDNEKREKELEERRKAGKLGGEASASKRKQVLEDDSKSKQVVASDSKCLDLLEESEQVLEKTKQLPADNVNVYENVFVPVSENDIKTLPKGKDEQSSLVDKKEIYGDIDINEIFSIVEEFNGGITDDKKDGKSRGIGKHLITKLSSLEKIKNGSYTRQDYLRGLLTVIQKNKFHSHKMSGVVKIYYNLAELIQIANTEVQNKPLSHTIRL